MTEYKFIDLFAGIGGIRLGFELTGRCRCVFSSEWDKDARRTYEANHGPVDAGDITEVDPQGIPDHELLAGGFPCQPFSTIGRRQGFEHPTQGTLFFNIRNILAAKRPMGFLLENVPGLVTHDGGNTLDTIRGVLRHELGYAMNFTVLDAADFGLPQYRRRLYLVGFRKDLGIRVRGEDPDDGLGPVRDAGFAFPAGPYTGDHVGFGQFVEESADGPSISTHLQETYLFKKNDGRPQVVDRDFGQPVKTLVASYHKIQRLTGTFVRGGRTGLRLFTEGELKRLMGFDRDTIGREFAVPVCRTSMYRQFGNSVAVPVIRAIAERMVGALDRRGRE